jgi:hypothetical protein
VEFAAPTTEMMFGFQQPVSPMTAWRPDGVTKDSKLGSFGVFDATVANLIGRFRLETAKSPRCQRSDFSLARLQVNVVHWADPVPLAIQGTSCADESLFPL